jgi:AcrR family transcriptional regulator
LPHDDEVSKNVTQGPAKRRGRRPGGTDTKATLVAAAREVFTELGYNGATVRAIAARAGVDAAMVNHWFGGKDRLFAEAVLQLPFNPKDVVDRILDGPVEHVGERIVRTFLTIWDTTGGGVFAALMRSVTSHEMAAQMLREFLLENIFGRLADAAGTDDLAEFRATLMASQMVGLGMVRYVARFEPLASADIETVIPAVAPTLQRYLTSPLT